MTEIIMPSIGAGTTHGKIIQWHKREGDRVRTGEILADIETDKAVIELEAFDDGTLSSILIPAGDAEVAVGDVVAILETENAETVPASLKAQEPVPLVQAPQPSPSQPNPIQRVFASPSARRLAREHDIDITLLQGSGPKGRIVRVDIERARAHPTPVDNTALNQSTNRVVHSSTRKTIARRLQESKQQIPHFYLVVDVCMDKLMHMRAELNTGLATHSPPQKLSINDMLAYIAGRAVQQAPEINVRWSDEALEQLQDIDISVAVATRQGLITPIVRDIASKRLGDVARELARLLAKAHEGKLAPSEYQGGSLTLSNLGMHGIRAFSAIINPPQAAILAVGAVEKRPVVRDDQVAIAHMLTATLSADHRAIDGAVAAKFLTTFKNLAENPSMLLA